MSRYPDHVAVSGGPKPGNDVTISAAGDAKEKVKTFVRIKATTSNGDIVATKYDS